MCLAVPGKIKIITDSDSLTRMGKVEFGGIIKDINLSLVPDAKPGQYVLAHAGFAIGCINEKMAAQTLDDLESMLGGD
jgi:hydrogenase expression/formation protein HypC